ncbi:MULTISPECIES: bifunctional transcriptional activator/DNA repair enzyme AdaA [unclassified Bacillus (in: firmicutes)]|uniref:bifunctional transcriptional activator/DNA repair enzyme AdaA n=1 Tax=unclassified Bacillus (in: firmicutes) TaxID=185979 RepID=UPI000D02CD94|nr:MULTISPECIES: trifunctional transcriptional activator/DNA repair protein Ada/methylated-DNA--[protein]-cysteine S-methyltransferase [unclassified Bacillus (in: firmicutes)]PRS70622.1 bifunctional transcriptional activator/DNA repair enzyme protein Ada [Bacillus sp. NMTD17]PRS78572.1 bifunctional transcriptional activator/DNA repair enzyme protein Ada [Bacillus sp. GBSW2]
MMITDEQKHEFYQALVDKNPQYDGTFFAGIKTTGIFCHATCTARKPKYENCEFFFTAEEALLAGYRPCKRCTPLTYPNSIPEEVKTLVSAVETHPEKRWKEEDFHQLGIHSATARRKFKEIYGMTFVQYARSRRMGLAFKEILNGKKVIDQQVALGYESSSAFNDAFTKIMGNPPKKTQTKILHANFISTPIGRMISVTDATHVYLLEFVDRRGLEKEIENMRKKHQARILVGETNVHQQLAKELTLYFEKKLTQFSVPLSLHGTPFQMKVWDLLTRIPSGKTSSYRELAVMLGDPHLVRAVGNANGANQLAIIIPCHRVIQTSGELGGYGGGIERKKYLLQLEQRI